MKKLLVYLILIVIAAVVFHVWSDKPYCTIEFIDKETVRGKHNLFVYALSKLLTQRRELMGSDPYKMYIYISDPDGLGSAHCTVDGKEVPLNLTSAFTFEYELQGNTEIGLHTYRLEVKDKKGNTASAESLIKVSPMATAMPMI